MTVFWVTLFFLHQGYSLVPVVTVGPGEPVTFTCTFTDLYQTITWLHWYKQSAGETMKIIAMLRKNTNPKYGAGFSASRFNVAFNGIISDLRILRTVEEDEGMYHCALMDWTKSTWNGTYLSVKGDTERTSNYTVIQKSMGSDPSGPADSETLQCSVLSEPQNQTCSGGLSVFWFRSRSDQSHPDIIYTDGNRPDTCEKTSDPQRRCSYKFSKNISSSDAGTFYCAVATCGQIVFGNGTKLENKNPLESGTILLVVTIICLAISVIINIIFMCVQNQRSCKENSTPDDLSQPGNNATADGQDLNYAALRFSGGKTPRGRKRELQTEDSVYSQVKGSV